MEILKKYFDENAVCSVAEVHKLTQHKRHITIYLDVESSTRKALSTMAAESRDAWLALHCPPIGHAVWNKKHVDDYFVETPVGSAKPLQISCKHYYDSVLQRKRSAAQSVAARLRAIFEQNN